MLDFEYFAAIAMAPKGSRYTSTASSRLLPVFSSTIHPSNTRFVSRQTYTGKIAVGPVNITLGNGSQNAVALVGQMLYDL
jgi:uncharacterized membrane protein